jgi:hypothetical protein
MPRKTLNLTFGHQVLALASTAEQLNTLVARFVVTR